MTSLTAVAPSAESPRSPFDRIRQFHYDNSEFWTGRSLMVLMGYVQWRNFVEAVERAKVSCAAAGQDVLGHFADASNLLQSGHQIAAQPQADYELSRYACYLVAMNGDPRKPEVAAAQSYFAVMTHRQEIAAPARELTRRELLVQALEAEDRADALAQVVAELAPAAEGYDQVVNADGLLSLATAAQALGTGRGRLIQELHAAHAIMVRPGHSDHLRPYQEHVQAGRFVVKLGSYDAELPDGTKERRASSTTYVTPKGLDWIRGQRRS